MSVENCAVKAMHPSWSLVAKCIHCCPLAS